jgi:Putative transposase.
VCSLCCTPGRNGSSSTRTFTASSPAADCPSLPSRKRRTAPPGIPPARPSSSPNRRSPPGARARFRDAFARLCPDADLPPHVWQIPWVVHITPWGEGQPAALDYLARYAFRIAITNNRILAVDDATVTYRYKDRAADRQRKETVSGHEFIRRFLQHVLPAGFHKVRYYGLWHASRREPLCNLKNVLLLAQPASPPAEPAAPEPDADPQAPPSPRHCPHCKTGHLTLLRRLSPARPQGP